MRSRKNVAILVLSLTTVAAATVAWQQYRELQQLRIAATESHLLTPPAGSVGTLSLDVAQESSEEVTRTPPVDEAGASVASPGAGSARGRENRRDERGANFRTLMERPDIQRLLAVQQKSGLDPQYADLFRQLSLSPDQLERFKELLVEKNTAIADVRAAAREQGVNQRNDPATMSRLIADAQAEIDQSIRETLGAAGFAKYENYQKTVTERNTVNQLERRLSYSTTPLTSQQTEQMVAILAGNSESNSPQATRAFGPRRSPVTITDSTINQALGVLAAPQIEALRQLQQEQQAQSALDAAMREGSRSNRNGPPTSGSPSAPATVSGPQPASRAGG